MTYVEIVSRSSRLNAVEFKPDNGRFDRIPAIFKLRIEPPVRGGKTKTARLILCMIPLFGKFYLFVKR